MDETSTVTLSRNQIQKILSDRKSAVGELATRLGKTEGHIRLVLKGQTPSVPVWTAADVLARELVAKDSRILNPEVADS